MGPVLQKGFVKTAFTQTTNDFGLQYASSRRVSQAHAWVASMAVVETVK